MTKAFELDFNDLEPIQLPVRVDGNDYALCEANGAGATKYRNESLRRMTIRDGKATDIKDLGDLEPLLVSLCLHEATLEGDKVVEIGKKVPIATIAGWPARVQKRLFEKAKAISQLDEGNTERSELAEALDLPNAPCKLADLRSFVESLEEGSFNSLRKWLAETPEERAKNSPNGTTVTVA